VELRVPPGISALLFDLDGVLTQTSKVHFAAWKEMFDAFLREDGGDGAAEFTEQDYAAFVDGKPRLDGVRSFLEARGIEPDPELVQRLGTRKNDLVLRLIDEQGVERYDGSIAFVEAARERGHRCAVVSSSNNCEQVLKAAGIDHLFEARIDGVLAEREGLRGKPAPDTFLEGARRLGASAAEAAVFEDAIAGVEAGRAGAFGWVVGVDRIGQADALRERGADVVVQDLGELVAR
jgi:beta-phosphoglucomutase family hydrolase